MRDRPYQYAGDLKSDITIMTADHCDKLYAQIARLTRDREALQEALRNINNLCNAPHWKADRRWRIERISADALAATED